MTIETEQSVKVSNENLLVDIFNTEKEANAYHQLMNGFSSLSELPENIESGQHLVHRVKSDNYYNLEKRCRAFLEQLYQLKKERGL